MAQIVEFLTLGFVAISSTAALVAVLAGWREVRIARTTHRGQVFVALSQRYGEDAMQDAVHALRRHYHQHPETFASVWQEGFRRWEPEAIGLDRARRRVVSYFFDVLRLYELGILDRPLASALLRSYGGRVYAQICLPMGEPFYQQKQGLMKRFEQIDPEFGKGEL